LESETSELGKVLPAKVIGERDEAGIIETTQSEVGEERR
jgi:hypothetical protein